jgi:uncharacterized protein (DUF4213/DUF364 family)
LKKLVDEQMIIKNENIRFIIESGRFLVTESGRYITKIIDIKESRGKKLFGEAEVFYGKHTLDLVKQSDVAIVTGMTLTTEILDEIIKVAKENDTKVIIFAETGAHLGEFYLNAGADVVIS